MPNKKISQLTALTNPTGQELFAVAKSNANYSFPLSGFTSFLSGITSSGNVKHWLTNENKVVASDETVVISGNYVLENSTLTLESTDIGFLIDNINFNKYGQLFINGYLLLINSDIVNNGQIDVGGGIIFSGDSTITGTGIIT